VTACGQAEQEFETCVRSALEQADAGADPVAIYLRCVAATAAQRPGLATFRATAGVELMRSAGDAATSPTCCGPAAPPADQPPADPPPTTRTDGPASPWCWPRDWGACRSRAAASVIWTPGPPPPCSPNCSDPPTRPGETDDDVNHDRPDRRRADDRRLPGRGARSRPVPARRHRLAQLRRGRPGH